MLLECYSAELAKRRTGGMDAITKEKVGKVARWLCGETKPGLLLYGTVGSGKTTMARAVCELIRLAHDSPVLSEKRHVRQTTAIDLIRRAQEDERGVNDAEMLLIDDLGTEPASIKTWGNERTPVIDLLLDRYDRQSFTIITSNLDDAGIAEFYGERIADRFREMFDTISYANESFRK